MTHLLGTIFIRTKIQTKIRTMNHKVFVYGTLKRNEPNHHWLTNPEHGIGKFITEGTTKTKYPLIIGTKYNIPFLLYSPGDGHYVRGEVYEVDDTMLSKLDILEDHPNYYVREIDDIIVNKSESSDRETVKCWVYFLKNFRPDLLSKEQFENYSSMGSHGLRYLERSKRDPNDNYYHEVKH
ncbi:putative gamma-glutamylcyclotransferase CG2811 isoform X1 [Pararge aegeria]|uniref:putative gamma-glutamylcyclotransferase CG2811 isoform X1 n=1 Tax=Pararge aegeria TaxID=116150 RepID=UPI0019CF818F|nr:putative gamma-glutamylcyclotransferase CG2811 isoform X1 [Pararge aegeria]